MDISCYLLTDTRLIELAEQTHALLTHTARVIADSQRVVAHGQDKMAHAWEAVGALAVTVDEASVGAGNAQEAIEPLGVCSDECP
jgi:hypothetical protein